MKIENGRINFSSDKEEIIFIIILVAIIIAGAIGGLIHYSRLDKDLKEPDRFDQIQKDFENEFKKIEKPPKTAVNSSEISKKIQVGITVTTRYRTELPQDEFQSSFKKELERIGWKYYGYDNSTTFGGRRLKFCKGKFDADLTLGTRTIWNDGADYYRLSFSFGHRNLIFAGEKLPSSCY